MFIHFNCKILNFCAYVVEGINYYLSSNYFLYSDRLGDITMTDREAFDLHLDSGGEMQAKPKQNF